MRNCVLASVLMSAFGMTASAVEPAGSLPVEVIFEATPPMRELPPMAFYRPSAYDVWQNLAVDGSGRFRARVIWTPDGAFYRYNGKPYPWVTTSQTNFIPYMPLAAD